MEPGEKQHGLWLQAGVVGAGNSREEWGCWERKRNTGRQIATGWLPSWDAHCASGLDGTTSRPDYNSESEEEAGPAGGVSDLNRVTEVAEPGFGSKAGALCLLSPCGQKELCLPSGF